jgi:hypothetical protein
VAPSLTLPRKRTQAGEGRVGDRGQGAARVLAEILVTRRVERVEGEALVLEAHHGRGDRDAALALDRHPIRAYPPPRAARLHLARQLDAPPNSPFSEGSGCVGDLL